MTSTPLTNIAVFLTQCPRRKKFLATKIAICIHYVRTTMGVLVSTLVFMPGSILKFLLGKILGRRVPNLR